MNLKYDDHKVAFRREETIAEIALAWRRAARNENSATFNVVDFALKVLRKRHKKGTLLIEFYEGQPGAKPAYVTFDPLTLHVDSEVWELAGLGDPESRFVVAHEIGHIVLHDHNAQGFSEDPNGRIKFATEEESAEWQADVFAHYFLVPNVLAISIYDRKHLAEACSVTRRVAENRMRRVKRLGLLQYEGDACGDCGNFTLVRDRDGFNCDTCGSTTGCS